MALQNLFVPRGRIATFDVSLRIEDLNNVPPLGGLFFAKWRCQANSGASPRMPVANREVRWAHAVEQPVEIPISKDGTLAPCELRIAIRQEVYSHVRTKVGTLTVNLSEYARLALSSRRYFLQECRLNCTLKLSIAVTQTGGTEAFEVPPLDRSMVLTDLSDIIPGDAARDAPSAGNSLSSQQAPGGSAHSTAPTNSTESSQPRALLPIDNTNIRDLAPFQRASKKNKQIVDDVFHITM